MEQQWEYKMAIIRNFRLPLGIGVSADYIETYGVIESSNTNTGSIVARGGQRSSNMGGALEIAQRFGLIQPCTDYLK